jgi:hypothetical protein
MSFEEQVKKLTADNINEIETHYSPLKPTTVQANIGF